MTDEQKEVIRELYNDMVIRNSQRLENDIKRLFPEAFEPELVDFNRCSNRYWVTAGYPDLGVPGNCGLFFSESNMKNPKMQKVGGGWVLTFERK